MKHEKQLKELEKLGNKMRLAAESWDKPWKTLISTIMSARTRDEITIPIANLLFSTYKTIESLSKANIKDIEKIIRPVNFYKNKSKHILNTAKLLVEEHKGQVPKNIELLMKLPGVGRKTANVFLSELGEAAIAVDTHVSYISQRLGWSKSNFPKKIEEDLKILFPKKLWKILNPILVRFGKTFTSRKKKDEHLDRIKNI